MSSSSTDSNDEYKTPRKAKRRYRRTIHHGISERMAKYHQQAPPATSESLAAVRTETSFSDVRDRARGAASASTPQEVEQIVTSETIPSSPTSSSDNNFSYHSDTSTSDHTFSEEEMTESTFSSVFDYTDEDMDISDDGQEEAFPEILDPLDICEDEMPVYDGSKLSKKASYTMVMIFVTRYKLPKSGFLHLLQILAAHLPKSSSYCTSVYKIKEKLKKYMDFKDPVIHKYCEKCQQLLHNGLQSCTRDICVASSAKTLEFHDLQVADQLTTMFKDPSFINAIKNQKDRRNNLSELGDISKTNSYKEVMQGQKKADVHLTFTMNTDGVSLFTSSKKGSLWPVYLAINELPIKLRFARKYLIPCYLHCQVEKPNMVSYLTPMGNTLKELQDPGLTVTTSNGSVVLVRAKLMLVSVDLPARALVLNMKQFNGKYGCSICLDEGESPAGQPMLRFYPYKDTSTPRTHQSMLTDARKVVMEGGTSRGIKGVNPLMMIQYLDIPKATVVDWMHNVLLGVTKALLTFWLNSKYKDRDFFIGNKIDLLNKRFLKIKIPGYIARRPRTLHDHSHWKATEYREWLIHFSVPVLNGVLDPTAYVHYLLLVTSLYLLTRDDLDSVAITEANTLLLGFCKIYPSIYGERAQTMNVHLLKHLPQCAKMYGPLFGFSCFGFESMNSYLKSMVHGTRHINKQVSFAVGMSKKFGTLVKSIKDADIDETVQDLISELCSNIVLEENAHEDISSSLGKKKPLSHTDDIFQVLPAALQTQHPAIVPRIRFKDEIYYSKKSQTAKTRNDSTISYVSGEYTKYGNVVMFIECGGSKYAIIEEIYLEPFKLDINIRQAVQNQELHRYFASKLCPHIQKVTGYSDEKFLTPVENLRKKCILVQLSANLTFLSYPANLMEHN